MKKEIIDKKQIFFITSYLESEKDLKIFFTKTKRNSEFKSKRTIRIYSRNKKI